MIIGLKEISSMLMLSICDAQCINKIKSQNQPRVMMFVDISMCQND